MGAGMSGWLVRAVCLTVRAWSAIYTLPLEPAARRVRRGEIESSLWEFLHDDRAAADGFTTAVQILGGALLAMPDDVLWMCEQLPRHAGRPRLSLILRCAIVVVAVSSLAVSASGPSLDVASAVKVNVAAAGWMVIADSGTEATLAPTIVFTVTNASDRPTGALQVNAQLSSGDARHIEMGTAFSPLVGWRGLRPGASSVVASMRGQSQLLVDAMTLTRARRSSLGIDGVRVNLLVQHEGHWTRIG